MLESIEVKLSGTAVNLTPSFAKMLIASADVSGNKITPRYDLKLADFADSLWWVGDYGTEGGCVAIRIDNALSTSGFQLQTTDKKKGKYAFEFTAHPTLEDADTPPFEIFIKEK